MLRAAGMHTEVLETQHAGHATELARNLDLSQSSTLVMVGGDGTVHEVLQVGRQSWVVSCGRACLAAKAWCLQKAEEMPETHVLKQLHVNARSQTQPWTSADAQSSALLIGQGQGVRTGQSVRRNTRQGCCVMGLSAVLKDWCCDLDPHGAWQGDCAHSAAGELKYSCSCSVL